jgi:GMP synthase-like glutamine amidotransferase
MIRIAILDLYEGQVNQGMRCLRQTIREWSLQHDEEVRVDEFDVRLNQEVPDLSYHIYISSGGPGSPIDSIGSGWENAYFEWLQSVEEWNRSYMKDHKKYIFLICHSFEIVCRQYDLAVVNRRRSNSFGVFPVHLTPASKKEKVFEGLEDPFYVLKKNGHMYLMNVLSWRYVLINI